jgi:hypothetical protein
MSQAKKGKLNYRCPSCFMRDLDIDMFYDAEKKEYYCLRCCFHGTEEEVLRLNEVAKYRYKDIEKRVVDFSADNAPIKWKMHKKGEE